MNHGVDIIALHTKILEIFETEKKMLSEYEKKLVVIEKTLSYPSLLKRTRIKIQQAWSFLKEKIEGIKSNSNKSFYLMETAELIQNYQDILKKPRVVSFMGVIEEESGEKLKIVEKYLALSRKFFPNLTPMGNFNFKSQTINKTCANCEKETEILDINGFAVCHRMRWRDRTGRFIFFL